MRGLARMGLVAVMALVVVTSMPTAFGAPLASPATVRPAHAAAVPRPAYATASQVAQIAQSTATAASAAVTPYFWAKPQGGGNLANAGGGPVQAAPTVYLIFWGAEWGSTGAPSATAQLVQRYFQDVAPSYFANVLTQYAGIANAVTLGGVRVDAAAPPTDTSCGAGTATVQDSAIQAEVGAAIAAGWPTDAANALYLVYPPGGTTVNDGRGACSERQFCTYHKWSSSVGVAYAAVAYPSDAACQVPAAPNGDVIADSLVSLSSSVHFGAITDPHPGGAWVDATGLESEQKCAGLYPNGAPTALNSGGSFMLLSEYSAANNACTNDYAPHLAVAPAAVGAQATSTAASPAPQTLTVKNTGAAPLHWSVTSQVPSWLALSATSGTLAPNASQQVTLTFTLPPSAQAQTLTTNLTLADPAADNSPVSVPVTAVATNVSKQWYFAEGYTGSVGGSFDTKIALANPNATAAHVTITYHLSAAPWTVQHTGITMAPYARFTDPVNQFLAANANNNNNGAGYGVATVVQADQPIVAERPMYFAYSRAGTATQTGFDVMGATGLSSSFAFDDLDAHADHTTLLTILNPAAQLMYATLTLYPGGGTPSSPLIVQQQVPANARGAIDVGKAVVAAGSKGYAPGYYSGVVTLSADQAGAVPAPGLVERPMYWTNPQTGYRQGECVIGAASAQTAWDFAEGWTSAGGTGQGTFQETLYLASPAPTGGTTANVTVTIYRESDPGAPPLSPVVKTLQLPSGQLTTVNINALLPGFGKGNSIRVTSDQPILAERLLTWDYGTTDLMGAQRTANAAYFAESYTGPDKGGFTEILTLENPNPTPAYVTITYLPANDANPSVVPPPVTMTWTIPADARSGFPVNPYMPNQGFSVVLVSSQPILAERVMYFQRGGTDAAGYQGEP